MTRLKRSRPTSDEEHERLSRALARAVAAAVAEGLLDEQAVPPIEPDNVVNLGRDCRSS